MMIMNNFFKRLRSYVQFKKSMAQVRRSCAKGEDVLSYAPSSLNLLMIDKCNARCVMCGHDYQGCGTSESLTLEKIQRIYSKLDLKQLVEVVYGGGGEPFLNPELTDIAEYTSSCCPAVQHTVISNMVSKCSHETLTRLIKSRVHFLVSVNAATSNTFHEVAGVDAFEYVCRNIKDIVALRDKINKSVSISISIILMRQNIDELPEFVKLANRLGVDGVKAMYVRIYPEQYRIKSDGKMHIQPEDSLFHHQQLSNDRILEAEDIAKNLGVRFEHQPLFGCSKQKERDCLEPWRSLYIGFNGELYPCAASEILFMHKVASGQYQSGNILNESLEEIWNNPFWRALRRTNFSHQQEELIPECLCCGSTIDWNGVDVITSHVMDWTKAENSGFRI